jgi:Xaa-Pro aminopeptidase
MNRLEECGYKADKIRSLLKETDHRGIVIRKQPNFSWISAGGRGFIGLASEASCAALVITAGGIYLAGNNIELPRLLEEELPKDFAEPVTLPWQEDGTLDAVLERRFGKLTSDTEQDAWFKNERLTLLESEILRFAELGKTSAAVLEAVCAGIMPGVSEFEIAGEIAHGLWSAGIEPITVLVAADSRSKRVRHYVPTRETVRDGVICSICARSTGLVASVTRTAAFKKGFAEAYEALLRVEQAAFESTVPGSALGSIMQAVMAAYEQNGLGGEWKNHHQGGLTGYLAREIRASEESRHMIRTGQAFAWNPSASGAKCEDTVVLETEGLRCLTGVSPGWPSVTIGGLQRPGILKRF